MSKATLTAHQLADQVGMLSRDEVDLIQKCVKMLGPKPVCVNIGANVGTSALAILEAAYNAFVFSIDKRPCPEERENIVRAGLNPAHVVRVLGNSAAIGVNWPYPVDLLIVDGAHDDAGVKADIAAWIPRLVNFYTDMKQRKAIALFHDYKHPNLPRLTGIVDEAMKDRERIGEARYMVAFWVAQ